MKKIISTILVLVTMVLCFASCDSSTSNTNRNPSTNNTPTTVTVSSVSLSKTELNMTVGEKAPISATVLPSNATNKNVTWSSTNTAVADYVNGNIVALGEGTCIIKAKAGLKESICVVNVEREIVCIDEISFESEEYTFTQGTENEVNISFSPEDANDLTGTVTVDDSNIATASYDAGYTVQSGNYIKVMINAQNPGTTTITLNLANGVSCSAKITVVEPLSNFDLIVNSLGESELTLGSLWSHSYKLSATSSALYGDLSSASKTTYTGTYSSYTLNYTYHVRVNEEGKGSGYCVYQYSSVSQSGTSFTSNRSSATVYFDLNVINLGESTDYILNITETSCMNNNTPVYSNSYLSTCKEYMYDFTDTFVESFVIIIDELN